MAYLNRIQKFTVHSLRVTGQVAGGRYRSPLPALLRSMFGGLLLLFMALLFITHPRPSLAQAPDAEVDFFVVPDQAGKPLTVGDRITLRLEVNHPADSRIILPQLEAEWEAFEVVDQTPPEVIDHDDGTATTTRNIVVTLFAPGQYQTPSLVVTHRKPDGSLEELAAPVVSLNISSVLTDDLELRDLKPQADLPVPPLWPWVVGGLLASILLAGLLFGAGMWAYHRWKNQPVAVEAPRPVVDTRPPEVIAYAELDRIQALNLPAQNKIKEHYTLVADCLRFYIEGRYQILALEKTTAEVRHAFVKATVPMRELGAFMTILSESDLVKFARYNPPPDEVSRLIAKARTVVDATTPLPAAEKAASPQPEATP
ncbi:MAG: hypothetical protein AB1801_08460 [Chloroflexota bacterium]